MSPQNLQSKLTAILTFKKLISNRNTITAKTAFDLCNDFYYIIFFSYKILIHYINIKHNNNNKSMSSC